MPTFEQVRAAETKMRKAQHRVFDYVQGAESTRLNPGKYHELSEAATRAENRYLRLVYEAHSEFMRKGHYQI